MANHRKNTSASSSSLLSPVLLIGGTGFLGSRILAALLALPTTPHVSVLDIAPPPDPQEGASYHTGSIASLETLNALLNSLKPRTIIHAASPNPLTGNPELYRLVNIEGTRNILLAASRAGTVRALVYTSSASVVYDNVGHLLDADETLPLLRTAAEQREAYSASKALAEELVLAANSADEEGGLRTCALRPAALFGEGDGVISTTVVTYAREGKLRWQLGGGGNCWDYTYVQNVAEAHVLAAQRLLEEAEGEREGMESVAGQAFFITNDEPYPFWHFSRELGAAAGYPTDPASVWVVPRTLAIVLGTVAEWWVWGVSAGRKRPLLTKRTALNSTGSFTLNIAKAKRVLGYRPSVGMEEGIRRTGGWFREQEEKRRGGRTVAERRTGKREEGGFGWFGLAALVVFLALRADVMLGLMELVKAVRGFDILGQLQVLREHGTTIEEESA